MSQTMNELDDKLDEAAAPTPKAKTPAEMNERPGDLLDPQTPQTIEEQQRKLDDTWKAPGGQPGSGANEGQGDHDSSINDNDSKNGPAR